MSITHLVGLDFETYASVSLPDVGLMRYINDEYFEPTLASVSMPDGSLHTIEFPWEQPDVLRGFFRRDTVISAHNAGFETAVLRKMGIEGLTIIDSAVVAAVAGADRHLAGAARQLMNTPKLDEDRSLLRRFALRQEGQVDPAFDRDLITKYPLEWERYRLYCERDASLSRGIILDWSGDPALFEREMRFAQITLDMNEAGWPVDVASVEEMRERYNRNLEQIQYDFARDFDPGLNIFSHAQVKKWCRDRGITSNSFDKQNVERLLARLAKLEAKAPLKPEHYEVQCLLKVKQALGGSSLKKLDTILATQYEGRVYDQYVHAGAPQSLRTSGRSIQMQNLPRLEHVRHMEDLHLSGATWSNDELAGNLRQVFTSSDPAGQLLVADFASIESRALAYQAGEEWKVDAYTRGEDVYKAQAMKIFGLSDIATVTKEQRTTGKVGELSCGYGAGPVAVKDFAAKMHVEMTETEAGQLVRDWRDANPNTVDYWTRLGDALYQCVASDDAKYQYVNAAHGVKIAFVRANTPASLLDQVPDVKSVHMIMWRNGTKVMVRTFHGCYLRGRNVGYYKPSSLKGGRPWKKTYVNPKTKRQQYYELYGGKLAGILTQSMCREIFFEALDVIASELELVPNATLVGQFHDEVVVDWVPGRYSMAQVMGILNGAMTYSPTHPQLPMGVEVKHDYRYTK